MLWLVQRPIRSTRLVSVPAFMLVGCAALVVQAQEKIDATFFTSKVEPLLKAKCFECHSHDSGSMEGGLTLDSKSGWETGGDSGPAIVPGKPDQSRLIKAVHFEDDDLQMPPDEKLSDKEIAILVKWVRGGAFDPRKAKQLGPVNTDWWSLKKLETPRVPGTGHPIDAFIRKQLPNGTELANRADRTMLVRRLYMDLHGFQPTPEEVKEYVDDKEREAYSNLVNKLLASPRYGERWARHWLDVIHFADSHGCEHDVKRPNAWEYRDYVIERLNEDVPWGRFIREQLAADVFFPNEPRLKAGLGFIAAGPLELSRAGTAPITFDYLDRDDMVTQTMAAFVSTTANCARCHAHKFDPVTQEDYYSLQAVFAGVGKGDIEFDSSLKVKSRRQKLNGILAASATRDPKILLDAKYDPIVNTWISVRHSKPVKWNVLDPEIFVASGGATLTKQKDGSIFSSGFLADHENYVVTAPVNLKQLTALRLEVLKDERLPKNGPGRAGNGNLHLSEIDLRWFADGKNVPVKLKIAQALADFDQKGWVSAHAIDGNNQTGWAIYPKVDQSHCIVFELSKPLDVSEKGKLVVTLRQLNPPKHLIGRFRLSVSDAEGAAIRILPENVSRGLGKPSSQRTKDESIAIAAMALKDYASKELSKLPPSRTVYGVSSSWSHAKKLQSPSKPKVVHLLRRGAIDKPVREVQPGALTALSHLPSRFKIADRMQESQRRAALADWLAHPDNPLTWRSVVNRVWHYHFGRGLCDTPNDFGRMGSQPTHPELLDWLAVWFRDEAKGSLKELHRLILTSQTWQQSSIVATTNRNDSDNRLFWRMKRQRMDAESYRDSVLRMAGKLDLKMGGPGIEQFVKSKGPQSTPALDYAAYDWESPGANRRSIYRVVWRGIPDPFMESMDFPDLGLLAPKRGFSSSALQSLALFNNDFVMHGSTWLAKRVQHEHQDLAEQVARAVQLAWLRLPNHDEKTAFVAYAKQHGISAFCRVLLNSNEFLFVD